MVGSVLWDHWITADLCRDDWTWGPFSQTKKACCQKLYAAYTSLK